MDLVSKPTLFSAAIELLPKVEGKTLGELTDEEEKAAVATAARLARAMAKAFADGHR